MASLEKNSFNFFYSGNSVSNSYPNSVKLNDSSNTNEQLRVEKSFKRGEKLIFKKEKKFVEDDKNRTKTQGFHSHKGALLIKGHVKAFADLIINERAVCDPNVGREGMQETEFR